MVLAIVVAIAFVARARDDNKTATTTTTGASTTTTVLKSAAGKPCVKFSDALPKGAPAVPVKTGPPPTSLVKEDLKVGRGAVVKPNASVTVNYIVVFCSTGKILDSSYKTSPPTPFPAQLGANVIKGWSDGIPGMRVGGERLLGIPPDLAYGAQGQPQGTPPIAPDETLWFVVSVVSTK